jgi:hypothetical protein
MALMYVPPVLINLAMMVLFWRTLRPGAMPVVGRVAALWRGTLDPAVALYTRRVTIAWTVFFGLVAVESIALAVFAPLHIWSLFTNCLNYHRVPPASVLPSRARAFELSGLLPFTHQHRSPNPRALRNSGYGGLPHLSVADSRYGRTRRLVARPGDRP